MIKSDFENGVAFFYILFLKPTVAVMKEYKVETFIYYSKVTFDSKHIVKSSKKEIQEKLDAMSKEGWQLTSTDATNFGAAVYIYLYFEREAK